MAIKTAPILTREDYNEAQVTLGLTYAEVAKETGLPRQYLSEFRSGTRNLLPEHQRKLRSHFEDRGIVFEDYEDEEKPPHLSGPIVQAHAETNGVPPEEAAAIADLKASPTLRSTSFACLHFAISPNIPASDLMKIIRQMEENETQLEELLGKEAKEAGLFGLGSQWDGETEADLQEAISLMAANFVLSSLAQGKSFVHRDTEEGEDAKTVRDVMNDTFGLAFTGVIANWVNTRPANQPSKTADPASAAEAPQAEEEKTWL